MMPDYATLDPAMLVASLAANRRPVSFAGFDSRNRRQRAGTVGAGALSPVQYIDQFH